MRYAQEKRGQRLHIVDEVGVGLARRALCGREADLWRFSINMPWGLGIVCHNCSRVYHSPNRAPRTYSVA